jgi:hypothetical protein
MPPCGLVSFAEGVVTMDTSGWLNRRPGSVVQSMYSATAIEQEARHAEPLLLSRTVLGAPKDGEEYIYRYIPRSRT